MQDVETNPTNPSDLPATESSEATPQRANSGNGLSARPQPEWLDQVEGEVEDVELVLKCLSRDSAKMCQTCDGLAASGDLDGRPVLTRCAGTKQSR